RARESQRSLSLMLIDLDHFKEFNEIHGHAERDEQLKSIAGMLRALCPEASLISRYSGDQFAIALPNRNLEKAEAISAEIGTARARVRGLCDCSIGVAQLEESALTPQALLLSA